MSGFIRRGREKHQSGKWGQSKVTCQPGREPLPGNQISRHLHLGLPSKKSMFIVSATWSLVFCYSGLSRRMQKGKDGKREMRTCPSWSFVRRRETPLRRSSSLSSSALRAVSHAVIDQKECKRMFAPKRHAEQKHRKRWSRNPSRQRHRV